MRPKDFGGMLYWTAPQTTAYCDIKLYGLVQGSSGQIEDSLLSVISVSGLNYHFLDHSRFAFFENNPTFLAFHGDLVAYDSNGIVIGAKPFDIGDGIEIVQGPGGDWEPYYEGCSVTCNGPNYAWRIQQFVQQENGGNAFYQLRRAFRWTTSEVSGWPSTAPYYEYMGYQTFLNTKTNGGALSGITMQWYDVSLSDWQYPNTVGLNGFATKIIRVRNIGVFRDAYGYMISPVLHNEIVGIQKTKGQWDGPFIQVGPYSTPTPQTQCVHPEDSWINLINFSDQWSNEFTSDLSCVGSWYDDETYDTEDVWCSFWHTEGGDVLSYNQQFEDAFGWNEILFADMMEECPDAPSFAGIDAVRSFFNFLPDSGSINSVLITKLGKQGPEPYLHLDYRAFFDVDGMFKGFSHTFEQGIYSLMMITQQGQPAFRMLDVRDNMTVSGSYADFIDVNVFPVPITGDTYHISLLSPLQTRINYVLADANGAVLHRQLLSLQGGEQGTFQMAPRSGMPSGVHVHRFEFADGSYTTVTSTK